MADHHSRRDTDEFPAVPLHPEEPTTASTDGAAALTVGTRDNNRRATGFTLGILLVLLLIIIGAAAYMVTGFNRSADTPNAALPAPTTAEPLIEDPAAETPAEETSKENTPTPPADPDPVVRPKHPELPSGFIPINEAAQSTAPAGDLNNVYTGTESTSHEFALVVRDEFVRNYLNTGELNGRIQATSPVTGLTYEMSCTDNTSFVTCSGGNNAVIYIA